MYTWFILLTGAKHCHFLSFTKFEQRLTKESVQSWSTQSLTKLEQRRKKESVQPWSTHSIKIMIQVVHTKLEQSRPVHFVYISNWRSRIKRNTA
jgi:hypothetical protein